MPFDPRLSHIDPLLNQSTFGLYVFLLCDPGTAHLTATTESGNTGKQ